MSRPVPNPTRSEPGSPRGRSLVAPHESDRAHDEQDYRELLIFAQDQVGFQLGVAQYDVPATRDRTVDRLSADLADRGISTGKLDLGKTPGEEGLLARLRAMLAGIEGESGPQVVSVVNLEALLGSGVSSAPAGEAMAVLTNANAQRDAFAEFCRCPVILWLNAYGAAAFARHAPDLWHWRSGTFRFSWAREAMPRFPWKRFWVPRGGAITLSFGGYLPDPDDPDEALLNPGVVPFEAFADTPCLALLGEPGIGKTYALNSLRQEDAGTDQAVLDHSLWLDLGSYASEERLCRDLFESTEFRAWTSSTYTLDLFLDSLDECLVHTRTVASFLADRLKSYPTDRLRLRIACRTADWPILLEDELAKIWGDEHFRAYELAPLRRVDVAEAARATGIDGDSFLAAVRERDVAPLANRPMTLRLLLQIFSDTGVLPATRAELYAQGCLILCQNRSPSLASRDANDSLSAEERLLLAERVAAVTMFCKRATVYVGADESRAGEDDATISTLSSTEDIINDRWYRVTPEAVREVLATGLFSAHGPGRMGWSHWTFAEFLAARFARTRGLTTPQMAALVLHPGASDRAQVVPQLQETAAWLAGMDASLREIIMSGDPKVLLRTSVGDTDERTRAQLVRSYLELLDEEKLTDFDGEFRQRYDILKHPRLADDLGPYITDKGKNRFARRAAIDIAEACRVEGVTDTLAAVALDETDDPHIRSEAAHAVVRIGDIGAKRRLHALLHLGTHDDPDDDLKAAALRALWPDHVSAEELFASIRAPNRENYIGPYAVFVESELLPHLAAGDLPVALRWAARQPPDHEIPSAFRPLIGGIMELAWSHLDEPGVMDAYVEASVVRLGRHDPILWPREESVTGAAAIDADVSRRRSAVSAFMPHLEAGADGASPFALFDAGLVSSHDLSWLLEQLSRRQDARAERNWAELVRYVFDATESGHLDLVLEAITRSQALAKRFGKAFDAVRLDSSEAEEMRAAYVRRLKWQRRDEQRQPLDPPVHRRVADWLDRFEAGDTDAWWRLNHDLMLSPETGRYLMGSELKPDLTSLPTWEGLDGALRARCVAAAERYLDDGEPDTSEWLGTDNIHHPAFAGYRALRLLMACRPQAARELSDPTWRKWSPIVVAFPASRGSDARRPIEELVRLAYLHAPDALLDALTVLIDRDDEAHSRLFITWKLSSCWDERLTRTLLAKAQEGRLKPGSLGDLLEEVLTHGGPAAIEFALSVVREPCSHGMDAEHAVRAAISVLNTRPAAGWATVWSQMRSDLQFGRDVAIGVAHHVERRHAAGIARELPEQAVGELYVWLAREFPHAEDPQHEEVHIVGERESVAQFRDQLLARLRDRGTKEAVAAIRAAAESLPHLTWLKYSALEAEKAYLRESWEGVSPQALYGIAANSDARLT